MDGSIEIAGDQLRAIIERIEHVEEEIKELTEAKKEFGSLRLDPELLDERQPFLGVGFHKCVERLRCLSFPRENLHSETGEPRSHRWIGQRLHGRRIEFADNVPWRTPGREKPDPA
jgi:hypothetical protein